MIKKLLIAGAPDMAYEKGPGGSNVEVIQRHIDEYTKAHFGAGKAQDKAKKSGSAQATRFIVEKLQIRNGKVRLAGIARKDADVALPPVNLRDVGKSRGGATGAEIASIVAKQMTQAAIASATRALAQEGAQRAKEAAKDRLRSR